MHVCGGLVALMGAVVLGPRIGRFPKKAVDMHSAWVEVPTRWNDKATNGHHTNGVAAANGTTTRYPEAPVVQAVEVDVEHRGHSVPVCSSCFG